MINNNFKANKNNVFAKQTNRQLKKKDVRKTNKHIIGIC